MKRGFLICLVLVLILNLAAPAYCGGPSRKLGRGLANIATFPLELPNRIGQTHERAGLYEAMTYGFLEGIGMMVFRAAMGVYETATFLIPVPEGYEPVMKDPEFFYEGPAKK